MLQNHKANKLFLLIGFIVLGWSYVNHEDTFAWLAFTSLVVIATIVVVLTYKRFQFSTYLYLFGLFWAILLLVGAKYTYTTNPLFETLKTTFNWQRNHYDRVGHFFQGFVPFMIFKEWFVRKGYIKRNRAGLVIIILVVLGCSALYEFLEYGAAIIADKPQSYVLGLQGDVWDTQNDMLMALIGAIVSHFTLGKYHDKIIDKMMLIDKEKEV